MSEQTQAVVNAQSKTAVNSSLQGSVLQRAAVNASPVSEVPPTVYDTLKQPGQPLNDDTQKFMESRFGHDFSGVRVHTDGRATESARAVNALAYTVGRNVVFGAGQYSPGTIAGKRLLAHELTHTIQQGDNKQAAIRIENPDSSAEQEAAYVGQKMMTSMPEPVKVGTTVSLLQRTPGPPVSIEVLSESEKRDAIQYTTGRGYDTEAIKTIQRTVGTNDDGTFGQNSAEKAAEWQSSHRLTVDGKVGPNTLWAIITDLRSKSNDLEALHLAQFVDPSRKVVTNTGADVTTLASGAPPGVPDMTETQADTVLASLGLLAKVIKLQPPTNRYDCHGFTFLSGAAWIDDDEVDAILSANGYTNTAAPTVGDIVIYRVGANIKHSGIVITVSGTTVTKIHSKWGRAGLYEHAPNDVPPSYGAWKAMHTSRSGGAILSPKP